MHNFKTWEVLQGRTEAKAHSQQRPKDQRQQRPRHHPLNLINSPGCGQENRANLYTPGSLGAQGMRFEVKGKFATLQYKNKGDTAKLSMCKNSNVSSVYLNFVERGQLHMKKGAFISIFKSNTLMVKVYD
jgi:hypothetical protein